ncbi:hypothetical protein ABPG75_004086 [Micractinium tetrahymenae]
MASRDGGQGLGRAAAVTVPWAVGLSGAGSGEPGSGRTQAHGTLSAADIDGAQPRRMIRAASNVQQPPPDPGMQPTRYTRQRACPQPDQLHVADIPGATVGRSSDWLRPRKQPLDPLAPAYQWLPIVEEPAPVPKFVRDTLDVSDIVGTKEAPTQGITRGLPSTMCADDIEGSRPGWRPQQLFQQPRDPLRTDICAAVGGSSSQRGHMQRSQQQQGEGSGAGARAAGSGARPSSQLGSPCLVAAPFGLSCSLPPERSPPPGLTLPPSPLPQSSPPPEHGVAFTVGWRKQRLGAKLAQAEAARQAQAAAEAAITAAAAAAAARSSLPPQATGAAGACCAGSSTSGSMAVMLKSLRSSDRDHTGRVQAVELASALQRSGLPLSQGEVAQLVSSVRDSHNSVEYRQFVSKLYGKLHQQQATAGGCSPASTSPAGASAAAAVHAGVASAALAAPPMLPQFVAARQRRLQTNVALALNQQPEALAAEAAEVAALPAGLSPAIPWRLPATKPFSKRMFGRQEEFGEHALAFSAGDPKAAEQAALQWRASKAPQHAWAMRRENRPSKQSARGGASSLPSTPPAAKMGMLSSQQVAQQVVQAQAHVASSRPPKSAACLNREAGSPLLAAERAAKAAGQREVALVNSLE